MDDWNLFLAQSRERGADSPAIAARTAAEQDLHAMREAMVRARDAVTEAESRLSDAQAAGRHPLSSALVTAMAIMMLAERGKLSFDDHLPRFPAWAAGITLWHTPAEEGRGIG